MILLDELDINEKEKEKSETLPPYYSLRLAVPGSQTGPSTRSSIASSPNYARSHSSVNTAASSQTLLVPPPPSASLSVSAPSTSRPLSSLSASFSSIPLPAPCIRPPRHLRASNNVHLQRVAAAITGSFLVDPALQVPDCLLPDDLDVLLFRDEHSPNGKGKQKRSNLCLVTHTGDISVDIWVREGCARRSYTKDREPVWRGHGTGNSISGSSTGGSSAVNGRSSRPTSARNSLDSSDSADYWTMDWTIPPRSMPWPNKTKNSVDIDISSESGSIMVRIHGQSHQRLRIRASSAQGSIVVCIPRTFVGYVQSDLDSRSRFESDSVVSSASGSTALTPSNSSVASFPRFRSSSLSYIFSSSEKEKAHALADDMLDSIVAEFSQMLPIPQSKQPVQFSSEMEGVVISLPEQRKSARRAYFVGDTPGKFSEHMSEGHMRERYFDELHLESYTGRLAVFYNDEFPQQKSDGIVMKLLNKAR